MICPPIGKIPRLRIVAGGVLAAVLLAASPAAAAGASLQTVPAPSPAGPGGADFGGMAAVSPADAWAAGSAVANSTATQTLALHFAGTSGQVIPSANPPAANGLLESVAGTLPGQPLWATGHGTTIETTTG